MSSSKTKVLFICHNHPSVRPGGAEAYALELYHGLSDSDEFEPIFLAKGGPPLSSVGSSHSGTFFSPMEGDDQQYLVFTDGYEFDWLFGTMTDKDFYTKHFRSFLLAHRPDIVHFQHTLHLGFDMIREVRNTLPHAPIVYTLHEFLPICHRQGQMVRTVNDEELCTHASPRRCHECFPHISPQTFHMRNRFIGAQFGLVDLFLAPSRFLLQRYLDWGIPEDKIRFEEYGRLPVALSPKLPADDERKRLATRFAYFGQLTPFKGAHVLLEAVQLLTETWSSDAPGTDLGTIISPGHNGESTADSLTRSNLDVRIHGANLDLQPGNYQNRFNALVEATARHVTVMGRYRHTDLGRLMAQVDWVVVPSIWWENSPLVIQEAFLYGRPVICSDIGGMAEKVEDNVNGLHFRTGDPASLAAVMSRAVNSPGLWQWLREGIPQIYPMSDHIESLASDYRRLLAGQRGGMVETRLDAHA